MTRINIKEGFVRVAVDGHLKQERSVYDSPYDSPYISAFHLTEIAGERTSLISDDFIP
jgi:hypothetical protein